MRYSPTHPDYTLSPFTGMTRPHWRDAARFLLEGAFRSMDAAKPPMVFARSEFDVSYPRPDAPEAMKRAEYFEGVARTFSIAAPLLAGNPAESVGGVRLADYYRTLIRDGVDSSSPNRFGDLSEMLAGRSDRSAFQQTVEGGLLALCLWIAGDAFWDGFSQGDRDAIARFLSDYGHYRTNHANWRWFNVLMLSFLETKGYPADRKVIEDHLSNLLTYYSGDGWYRDGNYFDYYSPWAFQFYGPAWCAMYGYEKMGDYAAAVERNALALCEGYARFFDRDGRSIFWGRSASYRCCASAPFAAHYFLCSPSFDAGNARRLMSGNLLQFLGREDVFEREIPSLGFYGRFPAAVQPYSCAGSPFWMGKVFACLALSENHPFWTETERDAVWGAARAPGESKATPKEPSTAIFAGPGIAVVDYPATGTSEIRTSRYIMEGKDGRLPAYARLAFNSAFPWEADPAGGPVAAQYVVRRSDGSTAVPNACFWAGERGGVLRRRAYFNFTYSVREPVMDLADFAVPHGLIRVDRPRIPERPVELLLAHYGLPLVDGNFTVERRIFEGKTATIVRTAGASLAVVPYMGWDTAEIEERANTNPAAAASVVPYLSRKRENWYEGCELLVAALLHRVGDEDWTDEDLFPVVSLDVEQVGPNGDPLCARIRTRAGDEFGAGGEFVVDFSGMDAGLSI